MPVTAFRTGSRSAAVRTARGAGGAQRTFLRHDNDERDSGLIFNGGPISSRRYIYIQRRACGRRRNSLSPSFSCASSVTSLLLPLTDRCPHLCRRRAHRDGPVRICTLPRWPQHISLSPVDTDGRKKAYFFRSVGWEANCT